MEKIDILQLREDVKEKFFRWYKNEHSDSFPGQLNTTPANYSDMLESFKKVLYPREIKLTESTLRKLFVGKNTDFHPATLKLFQDYVQGDYKKNISFDLEKEYNKWFKTSKYPDIRHHYKLSQEKFNEIAPLLNNDINLIKENDSFLLIMALIHGDSSMHLLPVHCRNNDVVISQLLFYSLSTFDRVSWRAAYILPLLNSCKVDALIKEAAKRDLNDREKNILKCIREKSIEQYLEQLIAENHVLKVKAYEVLKQIRHNPFKKEEEIYPIPEMETPDHQLST